MKSMKIPPDDKKIDTYSYLNINNVKFQMINLEDKVIHKLGIRWGKLCTCTEAYH